MTIEAQNTSFYMVLKIESEKKYNYKSDFIN